VEPTADFETVATLACPYPECPGVLPGTLPEELVVCPDCHRLSAPCPGPGKRGRCGMLNRPLARYCRQCRHEFPPGWATALWAEDAGGGRKAGAPPFALETLLGQRGQPVLRLDSYLPCDAWDRRPLGLARVGDWLWVSGPDGRCLFVHPFHDRSRTPPVLPERFWPGTPMVRLRAQTSGVWTLLSSEHGIKVLNLLSLDDPGCGECRPHDLWQVEAGALPIADPVLVRDSPSGLERLAVWLTSGPGGVTLWAAPLLVTHGRSLSLRRYALVCGGGPLRLRGGQRALLVPAPLADRDRLLLATEDGLWLLDPAAGAPVPPGPDGRRPMDAIVLLSGRRLLVNVNETPGVVFVPGGAGGHGDDGGTVYAAAAGRDSEELCAVLVSARGPVSRFAGHELGGVPLDNVTLRGRRLLLCRARRSLLLCDAIGQQTRVATSDALPWIVRADVHGRLAVCSGHDASEGSGRWFVQLWDLGGENALIDQSVTEALAAHPLLLGRYLFTVEAFAAHGRHTLWLTRRRLESKPR
jgi:hypothetical protein